MADFDDKLSLENLMSDFEKGQTDSHVLLKPSEHSVRSALTSTLQEVRKILHRRSRLSSRQEALDEISKLLFAHTASIDRGTDGIGRHILRDYDSAAPALRSFVADAFHNLLPKPLSVNLDASAFELRMHHTEDKVALELIDCFEAMLPKDQWSEVRTSGHLDLLNATFGQFLVDSFIDEKELGQYLTPVEVVKTMVALGLDSLDEDVYASIYSQDPSQRFGVILDPSCGVGSLLAETIRVLYSEAKHRFDSRRLDQWVESMLNHNVVGIDKSERMIRLATTNMALFGIPAANLHLANGLVRTGIDGDLCASLTGRASLILTNPPFGAAFSGSDLNGYKVARVGRFGKTVDSEVLFLERYLDWLAPSGVLVTIVPDSVLTNKGVFNELRRIISDSAEILSVISLPKVTFEAAGTSTKTSILHLRRKEQSSQRRTYFSVCTNIGFEVVTKGAHRHKVPTTGGQLLQILREAIGRSPPNVGRWVRLDEDALRWDANYHAGLPIDIQTKLDTSFFAGIRVNQVASITNERIDPRTLKQSEFKYVEISDVDSKGMMVAYKWIKSDDAPSRARKVIREGDVLVSTVRPERRIVAVVGEEIDGAICTTGFAVLRPYRIDPHTLAMLLQCDFVNAQIMRNNTGIAYPAIDENCLTDVLLPINPAKISGLESLSEEVSAARRLLRKTEDKFASRLHAEIDAWFDSSDQPKSQTSSIEPNHVPSPTRQIGFW